MEADSLFSFEWIVVEVGTSFFRGHQIPQRGDLAPDRTSQTDLAIAAEFYPRAKALLQSLLINVVCRSQVFYC